MVIHQLTGLTGVKNLKNFDREFALTNRLRTESIDYLLAGARAAGAARLIAQSYGGWTYGRSGSGLKTEDDPLDPAPPANQRASLAALRFLDEKVAGASDLAGLAFRYANFYGPGSSIALDGEIVAMVRKRQLPVIGTGAGVWSFLHIDDAAAATVAAVRAGPAGIYNIVDDQPAPVADWLPELARAVGARPPRHVPVWLGRVAAGDVGAPVPVPLAGLAALPGEQDAGWTGRRLRTGPAERPAGGRESASYGVVVALAGPDPQHAVHVCHPDLAVTDRAGVRHLRDGGRDGLGMLVRDDHVDPYFGQQHRLLAGPGGRWQEAVLLAETADLGHRQAAGALAGYRFNDVVELFRLDDRRNQPHGVSPPRACLHRRGRRRPQPRALCWIPGNDARTGAAPWCDSGRVREA